jgi:hypothetical protein
MDNVWECIHEVWRVEATLVLRSRLHGSKGLRQVDENSEDPQSSVSDAMMRVPTQASAKRAKARTLVFTQFYIIWTRTCSVWTREAHPRI